VFPIADLTETTKKYEIYSLLLAIPTAAMDVTAIHSYCSIIFGWEWNYNSKPSIKLKSELCLNLNIISPLKLQLWYVVTVTSKTNITWAKKEYLYLQNIQSLDCILRQLNLFHNLPPYFFKIHFISFSRLVLDLPRNYFLQNFWLKFCTIYLYSHEFYMPTSSHPLWFHRRNNAWPTV
jgi:hypothetical protein